MSPVNMSVRASLSELLTHLLYASRECTLPSCAKGLDGESVSQWTDEDYVYLEADLAADFGESVDICIQGGRAFIRLARTGPLRCGIHDEVMGEGR